MLAKKYGKKEAVVKLEKRMQAVAKDILDNYKKLLEMSGEDFIVLPEKEVCCGSPVLNAGFPDDFKNLAEKNLALFKEYKE